MNEYHHISEYEKTLNAYEHKLKELADLLDFFETKELAFKKLMDYYMSNQRMQDLVDDEQGLIPPTLPRGVLSEDAIYNLYSDYREQSLRMLTISTNFFKNN